jgi:hypothetical protein
MYCIALAHSAIFVLVVSWARMGAAIQRTPAQLLSYTPAAAPACFVHLLGHYWLRSAAASFANLPVCNRCVIKPRTHKQVTCLHQHVLRSQAVGPPQGAGVHAYYL